MPLVGWRVDARSISWLAPDIVALARVTSWIELAHCILVVAEIIRAQVAILTNDTLIARVLYADAIHTHARISVPITGLTSRVGGVLAPVVIGAVVSALVVVITRVLDADTIDTHAVFADLVNTIEVALTPVILRIIVALALMKVIDQAAIGGAAPAGG